MSEQHSMKIPAHYNIYSGAGGRELRIDFSTPAGGVDETTGLLILVPGFGGNIDSKVYTKMRSMFADQFNLITIQCDYFGSSYMQSTDSINFSDITTLEELLTHDEIQQTNTNQSQLLSILSTKNATLPAKANLTESIDEFNDMGYMQAIDLITSIEIVKAIVKDNGYSFDEKRIIGYGHSHGAYLLHLSNCLSPHLFSYLIDNSAWIEPSYMKQNRILYQQVGTLTLAVEFEYLAKEIIDNKSYLNLENLYKNYNGSAQIISFQGDEDNLIDHIEKERIISSIPRAEFSLITKEKVDQIRFKSNNHGLDADFLELFSWALEMEKPLTLIEEIPLNYEVNIGSLHIEVDSSGGLPIFHFQESK
ncbi:DUF2920 family protein [Exiguobacterium sp. S3]|uniref:DUF2920 family protein n=1 Tax=Exiguobacterium sp. S3 TaxID=483245 RepID=UPI001BE54307|nr:DUF2920 family protein [Exiguobacterium sp. S3]